MATKSLAPTNSIHRSSALASIPAIFIQSRCQVQTHSRPGLSFLPPRSQTRNVCYQRPRIPRDKTRALRRREGRLAEQRRGLTYERRGHAVPELPNFETFKEHGIEDLFTNKGFDAAWTQYHSFLSEKLTELTTGTALANDKLTTLIEKNARNPAKCSVFNYASMCYNNHEFFRAIAPQKTSPSNEFLREIINSFSSLDTLRTEMIETADAMFGPGFVWIVKANEDRLYLLCTYLAGTPLSGVAHSRAQLIDMVSHESPTLHAWRAMTSRQKEPDNPVGSFGQYSQLGSSTPRNESYKGRPILCVNTWPHVYLTDYGVRGKRKFLEHWWDRIDWRVVEDNFRASERRSSSSLYSPRYKPIFPRQPKSLGKPAS